MKAYTLILLSMAAAAAAVAADDDKWDISKMDLSKLPPAADTAGVTYDKDIKPIFKASCLGCHGEERHRGDLRLDNLEAVMKGGKDGKVLVAGDSKNSVLVAAIAQVSDKIAMPPKFRGGRGGPGGPGGPGGGPGGPPPGGGPPPPGGPPPGDAGPGAGGPPPSGPGGPGGPGGRRGPPAKPLTTEQVALVRAWIDQGAK